jgi:hypothetical protein
MGRLVMSGAMNPAAPHFVPSFIVAPGETDILLTGVAVFLVILVLVMGSMYFWLHSIPERISHGSSRIQFQLVAVLSLLALFTHNNVFWVAALLLALVPIPDFWTPLANMAESLAKMAGSRLRHATADESPAAVSTAAELNVSPVSARELAISAGQVNGAGNTSTHEGVGVPSSTGSSEVDGSGPPASVTAGPIPPATRSGNVKRASGGRKP